MHDPKATPAQPVKVAVVGAGHRAVLYASYALEHPDQMKITAVIDPNKLRRDSLAETHAISPEHRFASIADFLAHPGIATAVINGTMDALHVSTTLPLLKAGYDVLLEKPIATQQADVLQLLEAARESGRTVMICHVLRYAPFYAGIRQKIIDGAIGEILTIETAEHVCYWHMATSFIRGKHNAVAHCQSTMLLSKCCHDLDLVAWFKSGIAPPRRSGRAGCRS